MGFQSDVITVSQEIETLDQAAAIWSHFENLLEKYGIPFFIYVTVDRNKENPVLHSNLDLHSDTVGTVFDPFLDYCCNSYAITKTGAEFLKDYPYLDDTSRQFIQNAAQFGFHSGLGIPMRLTGSERYGGFNLGTGLKRTEFEEQIVPLAETLRLLCLMVHRRIDELRSTTRTSDNDNFRERLISPPMALLDSLTPREREVLFLIAKGFKRQECASICGISENTVSTHLKKSYEKLDIKNRAQATRIVLESSSTH